MAIDKYEGKVLAVGNAANEMIGRTPENIVAVRPMKDGVELLHTIQDGYLDPGITIA